MGCSMERDVREVNTMPVPSGLAEITPALLPSVIHRQLHADIVSGVLMSG